MKQTIILAMALINNRSRATYIQRVSELPDGIQPVLFLGFLLVDTDPASYLRIYSFSRMSIMGG
ncbi:hypothetical protein D5T98_24780 [Salmonella enterica]|nr:hypothetical protein [Salmonella enterica]